MRAGLAVGLTLCLFAACLVMQPATAEAGTQCKCKQHKAEAEADGTCSRTESSSYCTLKFSATPPQYREVFVDFLTQVESELFGQKVFSKDVVESLGFAYDTPPINWSVEDLIARLPLLFAISQRHIAGDHGSPGLDTNNYPFRNATLEVVKFVTDNADRILFGWTDPSTMDDGSGDSWSNNGILSYVSYGCIEVRLSDEVETMVKTRFSLGGYDCRDTEPDLYRQ